MQNCGFFEQAKYGIIVASNFCSFLEVNSSIFQMMKSGICVKETCTGTISKMTAIHGKESELKDQLGQMLLDETNKESLTQRTNFSQGPISSRISLKNIRKIGEAPDSKKLIRSKGYMRIRDNQYMMCKYKIKLKTTKSDVETNDL